MPILPFHHDHDRDNQDDHDPDDHDDHDRQNRHDDHDRPDNHDHDKKARPMIKRSKSKGLHIAQDLFNLFKVERIAKSGSIAWPKYSQIKRENQMRTSGIKISHSS